MCLDLHADEPVNRSGGRDAAGLAWPCYIRLDSLPITQIEDGIVWIAIARTDRRCYADDIPAILSQRDYAQHRLVIHHLGDRKLHQIRRASRRLSQVAICRRIVRRKRRQQAIHSSLQEKRGRCDVLLKASRPGEAIANGIRGAIARTRMRESGYRGIYIMDFEQLAFGRVSIRAVDGAAVRSQDHAVAVSQRDFCGALQVGQRPGADHDQQTDSNLRRVGRRNAHASSLLTQRDGRGFDLRVSFEFQVSRKLAGVLQS